jgi:hypothetical protein
VGSLDAPSTATDRGANNGVRLANLASGMISDVPDSAYPSSVTSG